jgi:hypothetical protein
MEMDEIRFAYPANVAPAARRVLKLLTRFVVDSARLSAARIVVALFGWRVLFDVVKGWLTDSTPRGGEMHHVQK